MSDLIDRQSAIDALNALHYNDREDWCFVLDTMEFLPSAQSEPRWILVTKEEMFKAGYEGREIRFRVDGRLFVIRELAQ